MQLISPKEIIRLSYDEWIKNVPSHLEALNLGTIFLVHGNPALKELYEKCIRPPYERREFSYFEPNPADIHRPQLLQKALFSEIQEPQRYFVDSYKPVLKSTADTLQIPLQPSAKLGKFY